MVVLAAGGYWLVQAKVWRSDSRLAGFSRAKPIGPGNAGGWSYLTGP